MVDSGALTGNRTLAETIPAYIATYDSAGLVFPAENGWTNSGLPNAIMYEGSFDLSGYDLDKLTFVPTGGMVQDPGRFVGENLSDVDVEVLDIICTERLDLATIDQQLLAGAVPGMMGTQEDWSQIVFGQYRVMSTNTNYVSLDIMSVISAGVFGSAAPSATSRLWIYRVVRINGTKVPTSELRIPAARFVLPGLVVKEEDLPYMMRLKRSYEISTQS